MGTFQDDITTLENAMRLLAQTMKRPQQWTAIMASAGIPLDRPSATILQTLITHEPRHLRVHDLAQQLGIESPSVTRKTQELEQAGYLRRTVDPQDRRAISLEVTAAGRDVAARLWKIHHQIISSALVDWPAPERHQFVSLFQRFSKDLTEQSTVTIDHERKTNER